MSNNRGLEASGSDYMMNNNISSAKHRRTMSNIGTKNHQSVIPLSKWNNESPSIIRSGVPAQLFISHQDRIQEDPINSPELLIKSNGTPSLSDFETYFAKRLKLITTLQSSLNKNLTTFLSVVDEFSKAASVKGEATGLKNELLKIIHQLSGSVGTNQRRSLELVKNLEELFYEHESRIEGAMNKKDTQFQQLANEANNFSSKTFKISNGLGCHASSLNKRLKLLLDSLKDNGLNEEYVVVPRENKQDIDGIFSRKPNEDMIMYSTDQRRSEKREEGDMNYQSDRDSNMPNGEQGRYIFSSDSSPSMMRLKREMMDSMMNSMYSKVDATEEILIGAWRVSEEKARILEKRIVSLHQLLGENRRERERDEWMNKTQQLQGQVIELENQLAKEVMK